jgi:hypothetical protein
MRFVLTLGNLGLVLAFAILVVSQLRLRSRTAHLVGLYLVAYADLVLVLQAAALLNALNKPVVLPLQLAATAAATAAWLLGGRPSLLGPFEGFHIGRIPREWRSIVEWACLGLIAAALVYVYWRHAELVLAIYPNNYDALTYHLSRVGYWLQYHSVYPWPTPDPRQTTFPMNAELGVFWTVLWWGSDRLSGFVQWITVPAIMMSIYGLTRLLGYRRWQAAFVAMMWATLPQVLFQSSSTQNDLVTASFWAAAVFLLFAGLQDRRISLAALSGLALGLAMGTKGTSFMVLPGLGIAVLALVPIFFRQRAVRRTLVGWAVASVAGIVLLGSYAYVQNLIAFGRPFGPSTSRSGAPPIASGEVWSLYTRHLRDNLGRYLFQLADFSPLPFRWPEAIYPTKAAVFSRVFDWAHIPVEASDTIALGQFDLRTPIPADENTAWFGPLAIFLFGAALVQSYDSVRHRDVRRFWLLVLGLGFLITQSAMEAWTPYKGRYYLIPISVAFPLLACLVGTRGWWRVGLTVVVAALGLASMFTLTLNSAILRQITWRDALSPSRKIPLWPDEFRYQMVRRNVPDDASIGLTSGLNFRDYPFFGEHFTHYVTLAVPDDPTLRPRTDIARFAKDFANSDYLLLGHEEAASLDAATFANFKLLGSDGYNSLWVQANLRPVDECDGNRWPFGGFYRSVDYKIVCPQFPITTALIATDHGTLYVQRDRFLPLIGSGNRGTMSFNLWARRSTRVRMSIRVDPAGFTTPQTLQLLLSRPDSAPEIYTQRFSGKSVVHFTIPVQEGASSVELGLLDGDLEVRILNIQMASP